MVGPDELMRVMRWDSLTGSDKRLLANAGRIDVANNDWVEVDVS